MEQIGLSMRTGEGDWRWYIVRARCKHTDVRWAVYTVNLLARCVDEATFAAREGLPSVAEVHKVVKVGSVKHYEGYVGYAVFDPEAERPKYSVVYMELGPDVEQADTDSLD